MKKCLKIIFSATIPEQFLQQVVQEHARKLDIEGTAQIISAENNVKIIACGDPDMLEELLDRIHKGIAAIGIETIEVEPFIKDKDYRGVFRIIE